MRAFFVQRWFLIALLLVLVVGVTWSTQLKPLGDYPWVRDGVVAAVMFCMALPLEFRTMVQAMRHPGPPLLAFTVSFLFLPLFAWAISRLLSGDLGPGLLVAAATPCSLASATVWTRRAGGNDSVATLVTILTNSLCFIITPLWMYLMTGAITNNPELSFTKLTAQLGVGIVLPMVLAQLLRLRRPIGEWSSRHKIAFSVASQIGILIIILFGAIRTGLKLKEQSETVSAFDLITMIAAVVTVHVTMFWLGVQLAKLCRFSRENQIAVGFAGSQKTLMVGLVMAITLKVSILPMVAYHCLQLFVDTLIADGYKKRALHETEGIVMTNDQVPMTKSQ